MKVQESDKLTKIAQELVLNEVIRDKFDSPNYPDDQNKEDDSLSQSQITPTINSGSLTIDKDDNSLYLLREARMDALRKERDKLKEYAALGHGYYNEVSEEEFAKQISQPLPTVCHFFSPQFSRCSIVDRHLEKVCKKHLEAKFIRIDARKAPFFVSMLKIRILPTILYIADGKFIHSSIGFSDFGGNDNFPTRNLLRVLLKYKIIKRIGEDETDDLPSESELDD